jgi:hypothetical protein
MNPEFADETPVNPFDLWEGANFKIKIRKIDGFSNYDKSEFATPGPLDEDETKMEDIWKTEYSLAEFTDPKNFKSYTELKEKLDRVLGLQTQPSVETSPPPFDGGKPYIATVPKMDVVSPSIPDTAATAESSEELSYFADLATAS